jgi:hypothetical protein
MKSAIIFMSGAGCVIFFALAWTLFSNASYIRKNGVDGHYSRLTPDLYIGVVFTKDGERFPSDSLVVLSATSAKMVSLPPDWSRNILITKDKTSGDVRVGDIRSNKSYAFDYNAMELKKPVSMALITERDEVLILIKAETSKDKP